ncbi:MAG: M67 family metallopeptidase [Anaerolineales bacterium]
MTLQITSQLLKQVHARGESAYPDEGAGLLLGRADGDTRRVIAIMEMTNARKKSARRSRYLITPQDMLGAEREASRRGLDVLGVFHSHPNHPSRPSEFDREWALPWFSYFITSVQDGSAVQSLSWRLQDDRSEFIEEEIIELRGV